MQSLPSLLAAETLARWSNVPQPEERQSYGSADTNPFVSLWVNGSFRSMQSLQNNELHCLSCMFRGKRKKQLFSFYWKEDKQWLCCMSLYFSTLNESHEKKNDAVLLWNMYILGLSRKQWLCKSSVSSTLNHSLSCNNCWFYLMTDRMFFSFFTVSP